MSDVSLNNKKPLSNPRTNRGSVDAPVQRVTSAELLAGRTELIIEHAGREYRLRRTQNGKLILTA